MQFGTAELRRGAFGQPSVPFLLSRRAHLLTTPKGRWYCQRLYRFGNRALCEADAASAEALWTMPHLCGAAVIVHADGYMFCFIIKTVVSKTEPTRRLPVKNINLMFFTAMGIASPATPIFFLSLRKRNKNERTVRTNGDLSLGSQGGQQRHGAVCGCRFRISELYQYLKRL